MSTLSRKLLRRNRQLIDRIAPKTKQTMGPLSGAPRLLKPAASNRFAPLEGRDSKPGLEEIDNQDTVQQAGTANAISAQINGSFKRTQFPSVPRVQETINPVGKSSTRPTEVQSHSEFRTTVVRESTVVDRINTVSNPPETKANMVANTGGSEFMADQAKAAHQHLVSHQQLSPELGLNRPSDPDSDGKNEHAVREKAPTVADKPVLTPEPKQAVSTQQSVPATQDTVSTSANKTDTGGLRQTPTMVRTVLKPDTSSRASAPSAPRQRSPKVHIGAINIEVIEPATSVGSVTQPAKVHRNKRTPVRRRASAAKRSGTSFGLGQL